MVDSSWFIANNQTVNDGIQTQINHELESTMIHELLTMNHP